MPSCDDCLSRMLSDQLCDKLAARPKSPMLPITEPVQQDDMKEQLIDIMHEHMFRVWASWADSEISYYFHSPKETFERRIKLWRTDINAGLENCSKTRSGQLRKQAEHVAESLLSILKDMDKAPILSDFTPISHEQYIQDAMNDIPKEQELPL